MSLGYASRLSYREDLGGQLGAPEHRETPQQLQKKIDVLTELIRESRKTVVFTGAGISTSCGIPDFRGPKGIWTLQRAGKELPRLKTSFSFATPSLTHQALKCLVEKDMVDFVVSQNVDGLHLRSGLSAGKLAELHGNCFSEKCSVCHTEYVRDFEMETVGFRLTGRRCVADGCIGRLKDNILDWDDPLPEDKLQLSEEIAASSDLALCLGTSLQIRPACNVPLETVQSGGKLVIVNLQKTPKDKKAFLVIRHEVDKVIAGVMKNLQLKIPRYLRIDRLIVLHRQGAPVRSLRWSSIAIEIISLHGFCCPIPVISSVHLKIQTSAGETEETKIEQWPFTFTSRAQVGTVMDVVCCIRLVDELDRKSVEVKYSIEVMKKAEYKSFLQTEQLFTHPAFQTKSKSQLPIIKHKECSFVTQEVGFE